MSPETPPALAAVIIARNEEDRIAGAIDAVLRATAGFPGCQVLLVDSRSTDRTVEIARRFPIRTVCLRDGVQASAALGRLVGERLTRSEFVLFVDGDTEIEAEWVADALGLMRERSNVGGVGGKLRELYYRDGVLVGENPDCYQASEQIETVPDLGGNAIYRRAALEAAGSFNPFILSYEEAELAERMRRTGYDVVRIPVWLGTHHTQPRGSVPELVRHFRENLIIGYGQVLRVSLGTGLFWAHARRLRRYLQFDAVVLAGLISGIVSVVRGDARYIGAWALAAVLLILAFMVRSRSVRKPFRMILDWSFWVVPMVVGFVKTPPDPGRFSVHDVVVGDEA